jgi:ribosomal protein L35
VHLAAASVTKMATIFSVYRAAFSNVVTAHTNHGKKSSARRNSDQKPTVSERDWHTLKRIVSKNR